MSIGATLAAARRRAGLTVGEVSDRTRVRESIIQAIERDDYAACGGDFYARGHIRAIARAVGEDPGPLIDEFDSTWGSARELTAAEAFRPVMPLRTKDRQTKDRQTKDRRAKDRRAKDRRAKDRRAKERRRVRWTGALAVAVLAVLGFASYKFVSGVGNPHGTAATAVGHTRMTGVSGSPSAQGGRAQSAVASTPPVRPSSHSPSATPSPSPPPAVALAPASVAAFGPGGIGDGDNPLNAARALGGAPARPWHSSWYTTAHFGNLKAGTGLLLSMGRTVTVSSVQVSLGGGPGADLELRSGDAPTLAGLPRVASAHGAGGTVRFRPGPGQRVRYLLIWFTKLPPDNAGTYQASVWKITVRGRP